MSDFLKAIGAFFTFLTALTESGLIRITSKVHLIYNDLNRVVDDEALGVHRASIIRVHNGGGSLSASRATYSSFVYEECRKPLSPVSQFMQNIPADKHYMSALQELKLNKSLLLVVDDMPPCFMRSYYKSNKIVRSRWYLVKEKKSGLFWREVKELHILSISTVSNKVTLDEDDLEVAMAKLITDVKRNLK